MALDAEWERVKSVFQQALDYPADTRLRWVDDVCADNDDLRLAVRSLFIAYDRRPGFLETAAALTTSALDDGVPEEGESAWIGRPLGAYRIMRELGCGGMGRVFLAERADARFDRLVAIKIVRQTGDVDLLLDRFARERHILAAFDHPNIARLLDAGAAEGGIPYVVMEYVDGLPIDAYCRRHDLSMVARLELFRQVCAAVHHAHQQSVVHRDLKPANILVTAGGCPKLLDFGIAKLLAGGSGALTDTRTGHRLLSPATAAPEQLTGGSITPATDVYALGVLLCQLLTARIPYRLADGCEADLVRAICETAPQKPSALVNKGQQGAGSSIRSEQLAGDIDTIVLKALRKEPERRYPSAEDLAEDVRRHLDGLRVLAAPDSVAYRTGKFVRRHRIRVAAGTAAVALSSGTAFMIPALRPAPTAQVHRSVASLAIAPFRELGMPLADSHAGWGMADALLTRLNHVESLHTRLPGSVLQPDPRDGGDLTVTGARLGVEGVIDGSIQQSAGRVRVTTRLVDVGTGTAVWSNIAEDDSAHLFRLQDQMTLDVARRLSSRLDISGLQARAKTPVAAAYDAYVNARYYLSLRTAADTRRAITHFERAIAEDEAFAPAYAGLADSYMVLGDFAALSVSHLETLPRARAAARQAVALDDSLAEAHASLAWITLIFDWNWPTAAREFQRALQLDERYTMGSAWYGAGLAAQGRFDEAITLLRDASARDPFSRPLAVQLVRVLYLARRFPEAVRECEVMAADTAFKGPTICELARIQIGDVEEALTDLRLKVPPGSESGGDLGALGYAYGSTGRIHEALQIVDELQKHVRRQSGSAYYLAEVYAGLGNHDATLASLEQARQQRWPSVILRVLVEPKFDLLNAGERARLVLPP